MWVLMLGPEPHRELTHYVESEPFKGLAGIHVRLLATPPAELLHKGVDVVVDQVFLVMERLGPEAGREEFGQGRVFVRVSLVGEVGVLDVVEQLGLDEELPGLGRPAVDVLEGLGRAERQLVRGYANDIAFCGGGGARESGTVSTAEPWGQRSE